MSILVKGMEMPKRCLDCPMYDCYNYNCQMYAFGIPARYNRDGNTRPEWCELVELPEKHGRLIDADTIMEQWGLDKATKYRNETAEQQHFSYSTMMMYEIADILDDAPVVIEAEGE